MWAKLVMAAVQLFGTLQLRKGGVQKRQPTVRAPTYPGACYLGPDNHILIDHKNAAQ